MKIVDLKDHLYLCDLEPGVSGRIKNMNLPQETTSRLAGLGICEGRNIHIVKCGEPYIVRTYGSCVGLASSLAHQIQVCVDSDL